MTCLVLPNQAAHADDYLSGVSMDFWKIYDQYYDSVRKFILAYVKDEWVADDLIQETFIKVQKNLEQRQRSCQTIFLDIPHSTQSLPRPL